MKVNMTKRGRPFEPGNKLSQGRPKGSLNKRTLLLQGMVDDQSESILAKGLALAQEGNIGMLRYFLDRVLPRTNDTAINLGALPLDTAEDLVQTQAIVLGKVASGEVTPAQAQQIDALLETRRRLFETHALEQRVKELEKLLIKNQDEEPMPAY